MMILTELSAERLREVLHYDPETGGFTWRVGSGRRHPGDKAGCLSSTLRNLCRVAKRFRESFHEGGWNFYTVRWMPRH
jgi:hypothetical protein